MASVLELILGSVSVFEVECVGRVSVYTAVTAKRSVRWWFSCASSESKKDGDEDVAVEKEGQRKNWAPGADEKDELKQLGVQVRKGKGKEWDWRRQAGPPAALVTGGHELVTGRHRRVQSRGREDGRLSQATGRRGW